MHRSLVWSNACCWPPFLEQPMDSWHPAEALCWSQAAVSWQLTPDAGKRALRSGRYTPNGVLHCPAPGGCGGPGVSCTPALPQQNLSGCPPAPFRSSACVAPGGPEFDESLLQQPVRDLMPWQARCCHRAVGADACSRHSPCICCIWLLGLDRCCSARLQAAGRAWAPWSAQ